MGEWLIGVYKGRLITATDGEKDSVWANLLRIHSSGIFRTHPERKILRPYFYLLSESPALGHKGDDGLLRKHGISPKPMAYAYSGLEPIQAYGTVEKGRFVLDKKAVAGCVHSLESLLKTSEGLTPAQTELRKAIGNIIRAKRLEQGPAENAAAILTELLAGSALLLALATKKGSVVATAKEGRKAHATGAVRTGTFFKARPEGRKIAICPCEKNGEYLSGKGALLGTSPYPAQGSMNEAEARREIKCPASRLCVKFRKKEFGKEESYLIYREISTDLRADMPIAMLKISGIENALEELFSNLGANVKHLAEEQRMDIEGRNILLDGTIVDYVDLERIDRRDADSVKALATMERELQSILYAASLISVLGKDALAILSEGKAETLKLPKPKAWELQARYNTFLGLFEKNAGTATDYFQGLWRKDRFAVLTQ